MKELKFEIKLLSPTLLSNGEPVGLYDDSFIQDRYRLPVFPAKRLKGLLRESCTELLEWSDNQRVKDIIDYTFGKVGGSNDTTSSKIRVFDGNVVNREDWIEIVEEMEFNSEILEVVDSFFSFNIAQTQIENDGIAKKGSLREFKLLVPKEEAKFKTKISFNEGLTDDLIKLIKIGLKNIRRIGTGRNRGWGKVNIVFEDEDRLEDCDLKNLSVPNEEFSQSNELGSSLESNSGEQNRELVNVGLKITALTNLIFPKWSGDENTVSTKDYIPGSMLWGAFAGKYIQTYWKSGENIMGNSDFRHLFYDGGLQFESAFPFDNEKVYKVPARHWVRSKLYPNDPFRNMFDGQIPSGKPIGKPTYFNFDKGNFETYELKKSQSFHNSRGADEKSRMAGTNQDSGIYYYESVNKGAIFYTEVKVEKGACSIFKELLKDGKLNVGKSKNNQFGLVSVEEIATLEKEANISDKELDIVFESPTILIGENGFPDISIANLARIIDLDVKKITHSNIRKENVQRFQGNLNVLLTAFEAITSGSSIRVNKLTDSELKKLKDFQVSGIGLETEKGFGRFRIESLKKDLEFREIKDSDNLKNLTTKLDLNKNGKPIVSKILFELAKKKAREVGFEKAGEKRGVEYKNGVYQALAWLASCKGEINDEKWKSFKDSASKKVKQKFIEKHNLLEVYKDTNEKKFDGLDHLKYLAALAYVERLKSNLK